MSTSELILEPPRRTASGPRVTRARTSLPVTVPAASPETPRRALNVIVACLGIAITAPAMLIIAAAIRLTSGSPVIFRQLRVGVDRRQADASRPGNRRARDFAGRPFTMFKFRTMRSGPPTAVWASRNDARVTPIGRILRRTRLDELPQLFNVLRGDMNVVGPRPEQPDIVLDLVRRVPGYRLRQRVLPGITGLAQVNRAYDASIEDVKGKVGLDLEYIARRGVAEDARIMARTLPVMLASHLGW